MLIHCRSLGYGSIDIRDPDQEADCPIRKLLRVFHLVEVARGLVIDRRPNERAQIADEKAGGAGRLLRELYFPADLW